MTKQTAIKEGEKVESPTGLALMRAPFPPNAVSQLPKPTKAQTDELKMDFQKGIRCQICGQWHHPKVVHLDYVGHAALTDRLLDCDPHWNWEPVALTEHGTPMMDQNGGMWIRLTVCGQTRLGYGDAEGKRGANAIKEAIGDALRNAAMRFGAALDLWHKGELHPDDNCDTEPPAFDANGAAGRIKNSIEKAKSLDDLAALWTSEADTICLIRGESPEEFAGLVSAKDTAKAKLSQSATSLADDLADEIPY